MMNDNDDENNISFLCRIIKVKKISFLGSDVFSDCKVVRIEISFTQQKG